MALHLIVDGYNFIRQSKDLRSLDRQALEFGRDALIDRLAAYRRIKSHKVTLVFDGSDKYIFPGSDTSKKGVGIKFSRHGESADSLIMKMASREKQRAVIVSSDREIANFAEAQGAGVIEAAEFEKKLLTAEMSESGGKEEGEHEPTDKRQKTTKKKGPARKLPKSRRLYRKKIKKL